MERGGTNAVSRFVPQIWILLIPRAGSTVRIGILHRCATGCRCRAYCSDDRAADAPKIIGYATRHDAQRAHTRIAGLAHGNPRYTLESGLQHAYLLVR